MIKFREKLYSEYDAMRSLYNTLNSRNARFDVISESALPAVMRGNNVVIEKFMISTNLFGRDKYRTYIKLGSRLKLPTSIRLPKYYENKRIGGLGLSVLYGGGSGNSKKKGSGGSDNKDQQNQQNQQGASVGLEITNGRSVAESLKYDKSSGTLILESNSIDDAVNALNILPFGISYKVFLLQ